MTTPWRNCATSLVLVGEINQRWPDRDRGSDGTIGDAAHATRSSDHNPWLVVAGTGVVRARDIDKDGIDAAWLAEYLRGLGARRDPRLWPGGYVIFNRRITAPDFSGWRVYTGTNPHTAHIHVSFTTTPGTAGFDSIAPWGIAAAAVQEADDMFTDEDRKLLKQVRADINWARGQSLSALGVSDPENAPALLSPDQAALREIARRRDVSQIATRLDKLSDQLAQLIGVLTPKPITVTPPKGPTP